MYKCICGFGKKKVFFVFLKFFIMLRVINSVVFVKRMVIMCIKIIDLVYMM